jgi:hypothetical protein
MDRLLPPDCLDGAGKDIRNEVPGERFCGTEEYSVAAVDRQKSRAVFKLAPKKNLPFGSVEIEKIYRLGKNIISLDYTLSNRGEGALDFCFCPQTDFSLAGEGAGFYSLSRAGTGRIPLSEGGWIGFAAEAPAAEAAKDSGPPVLEVLDVKNGAALSLGSEQPFNLLFYSVNSGGSISPGADEYQSTCFLPVFKIALKAGESWKNRFTLSIGASGAPRSNA